MLRTDFTDQAAWEAILASIREPAGDHPFLAMVDFLDDPAFDGIEKDRLLELLPEDDESQPCLAIVDREAIMHPEHPLLIVDLQEELGREFRAIPSCIQEIQINLSISNMDFEDFSSAVDDDGVFRGFKFRGFK